jgi:hypothetical protein
LMDMKLLWTINSKNTNISMFKLCKYCIHERSHITSLNHYRVLQRRRKKKNPHLPPHMWHICLKEGGWGWSSLET